MDDKETGSPDSLDRRQTLLLLGGTGATLLIGSRSGQIPLHAQSICLLNPEMTEGPYWVDVKLNRSDIRVDPSDGTVKQGLPLNLTINVVTVSGTSCTPLAGAYVDVWHCDAIGIYSDVAQNNTVGKKFLRGYLISDDSGVVKFTTIYPGWYSGRTIHIHLRVRTYSGTTVTGVFTSQLHFDDTISDTVLSQAPYNTRGTRDTRNSNDMVFTGSATASRTLLTLTRTSSGYDATITVGVPLAAAVTRPAINSGGIVNAASVQTGVVPQEWVTIFGVSLAAATAVVATSDLVNGSPLRRSEA
jgi:protocatechuate 3,4-dioxygenase beta subunit